MTPTITYTPVSKSLSAMLTLTLFNMTIHIRPPTWIAHDRL